MRWSSTRRHSTATLIGRAAVVLVFAMLAGCSCPYDLRLPWDRVCRDDIVFQDVLWSSCDPPCWRGITPGETKRDEILELVGTPPREQDQSLPHMSWGNRCMNNSPRPQVEITTSGDDGVVRTIMLIDPDREYTFADVVEEHGEPSAVMEADCGPEVMDGYIYLAYHEAGLAFASGRVATLQADWQHPASNERVTQWFFFLPTSTDTMLLEEFVIFPCYSPASSLSSEWAGFRQ